MTVPSPEVGSLELTGLDGGNPLGFLAALGAVITARAAGEINARLRWMRSRTWVPVIDGVTTDDRASFSSTVAEGLRGQAIAKDADTERDRAQKALDAASTAVKKWDKRLKATFKRRGLKGNDLNEAVEKRLHRIRRLHAGRRAVWLGALAVAVPRRELALGKRIDCTDEEYREHANAFRDELKHASREPLDLLAAFGTDACLMNDSHKVEPTPFCFIRGGGHQDFLDTVRRLVAHASTQRVRQTFFEPWDYRDPGLSMRWDPIEDARYALTDIKPADEGASTVWMANLLAYRGLALFTCSPTRRGLGTTGWSLIGEEQVFTWPIWDFPAQPDTIRSILQLGELTAAQPDRSILRARGVVAVFRARRIRVPPTGSRFKLNFSPARAV